MSPVSILPDGFGYVTFLTDSSDFFPETTTLQLLRFDSSGSYTVQQLDSEVNDPTGSGNTYGYCCSGAIIPDGQGGVLVAWQLHQINGHTETFHYYVTHLPAGGSPNPPYDLNYALDHTAIDIKMVLGENNTAFISAANPFGSYKLVSFDVNSGSVNWTWQPPQGHKLEMVVALEGGGVAVKDIDTASATQQIARFSASGSISYDGWSTAWLAPDSVSGEDTWNTTNSSSFSNVEETLAAVPANTSWPFLGGTPSGNGSPIAFLQEGIPFWGSLFAKKAKPPKCETVATAPKAQLTGNALARYNDQKQKLLTSGRLDPNDPRSQSCLAFFYEGDPNLPQYFNGLTGAVTNQIVYDGSHSSISLYDSGTWTQDDIDAGVATVEGLKSTPMSCAMDQGTYQTPNGTVAAAQSHPPATDMYINSFNYKMVTQGTILHESMHNLTRLSDRGLKLLLGLRLGGSATDDINHILEENGCAGTN